MTEIGQPRYACDVRTGWHVLTDGAWRLVLDAVRTGDSVLLVLRDAARTVGDLRSPRYDQLMTRTPQEQIQHVESQWLRPFTRGLGGAR